MNEKTLEENFREIEEATYKNSFERNFQVFVVFPGVIFTFIAGLYYISYLAPDLFSKVIIGTILVLGGFLWIDECLKEIKKRLEI